MIIRALASGSTGNCYHVTDGKTAILLECGIPIRKIRQGCGFKLSSVAGCFGSHSHQDHVKAAHDIIAAGIDLYCTAETAAAIGISGHRVKIVEYRKQFQCGSWTGIAFPTEHDVPGACGFLLASGPDKICFATDTYFIRPKFRGVTCFMIECNYSEKTLTKNVENGSMNPSAANRLLKSHFSLENVLNFFQSIDLSKAQEIHLIHISKANGDPAAFKAAVQEVTGKMVFAHG